MDRAVIYEVVIVISHAALSYANFSLMSWMHFMCIAWLIDIYIVGLSIKLDLHEFRNATSLPMFFSRIVANLAVGVVGLYLGANSCKLRRLSRARWSKKCFMGNFGHFFFWYFVHLNAMVIFRILITSTAFFAQIVIRIFDKMLHNKDEDESEE